MSDLTPNAKVVHVEYIIPGASPANPVHYEFAPPRPTGLGTITILVERDEQILGALKRILKIDSLEVKSTRTLAEQVHTPVEVDWSEPVSEEKVQEEYHVNPESFAEVGASTEAEPNPPGPVSS